MSSETFHNVTSGITQVLALVGGAYWAIFVFPDLSEAKRGWPGHPTVDGCVAIRTHGLGGSARYVEAGLTVVNNTGKDVKIDSVHFEVMAGSLTSEAAKAAEYDVENGQFVAFRGLPELTMTVKPGAQRAISGFIVRPRETKYYWRGLVIKNDPAPIGPYEFVIQAFVHDESNPFGVGRPIWLSDQTGRCPWNASPVDR